MAVVFFALFIISVILLGIIIKIPLPIWIKIVALLFISVGILLVIAIKGFIPLPIGITHFIHITITPKDLYEPIIVDNFRFYEKGFSKTYRLQPKFSDIYEIGFSSDKKDIPSSYKFRGKLKVEFFYKNKFLLEQLVTSYKATWLADGDSAHFKEISLLSFEMPLLGKYKKDVSVKITVLEPDKQLEVFKDSIKLYVSVSAIP